MFMYISLTAETIFYLFGLPITNSIIMTWLTMAILVVLSLIISVKPQMVPGKLQNIVESVLEFFMNLANRVIEDRALTEKAFPFVCTLFILIVLSNWLGLLPGVGTIGYLNQLHGQTVITPFFRPTNADINSTLSFAIISVVATQVFGIAALGFWNHAGKFINIKALWQFSFEGFVQFFVGILETFSELSKIVSFSFRLFGNVFAGEVLLTVIAFLVPYVAPLPFYILELFVGLIQGVVFTTLTLVFIKIATTEHGHDKSPEIELDVRNRELVVN